MKLQYKKLRTLGILLILICINACNKQDGSEKFIGFTAVGDNKEIAKFYIDTNTVEQNYDGLMRFKMVRVLPDGYVIQNAQTDCKINVNFFEGVKFRNDGTSQEKFSAENIVLPNKDNEINALVKMACFKGTYEVTTISDASLLSEATLKILLGVTISGKAIKTENKSSSVWFEQSFQNKDDNIRVIFIKTQTIENNGEIDDCHACSAEIGAVTYKKVNDGWQVVSKQLQIGDVGSWGDAPAITQAEILQISPDKFVFLISDGDSGQGYETTGKYVILFKNDKWQYLGFVQSGESNSGTSQCVDDERKCWNSEGKISVITGEKEYPDLLVTKTGTEQDDKDNIIPAKNSIHVFNGKEYESKNKLLEKQVVKQAEPNVPVAQINQQEVKSYKKWTVNWGNEIVSVAVAEPCQIQEFTNQGYTYSISSSIPISRLKQQADAWLVSGDRAITVMGCWSKKEGELIHAKFRRKKDGKTWEQDFKFDDGSWVGE
jgi:hypothetical protein